MFDKRSAVMRSSPRLLAILQAMLVTFLWSTSWVLIKRNINQIPPLTFAGLRYSIAFLILLPGLWKYKTEVCNLSYKKWRNLMLLGIVFYTFTQGGQFLTLRYLDAITFSLLLNFTTLIVAIFGIFFLRETPSGLQWLGILVFIVGAVIYFLPETLPAGKFLGLVLAGLTVCANAIASVLGRSINRDARISPLLVTTISMGVGAILLLGMGLAFQGLPQISPAGWATILWLAIVNTALAFFLWNKTLQTLSAVESSIINNTMLIQIAVLAWIFLGERIPPLSVLGLGLAVFGVFLVNWEKSEHVPVVDE
jgi:drug/metabolite transporter (DMT)-like permease